MVDKKDKRFCCDNCEGQIPQDEEKHFFVSVVEVTPKKGEVPKIVGRNFLFCHECYPQMVGLDLK